MTKPEQHQQIEVDLLALQQSKEGIAANANEALPQGISDARGRIYRGIPVGEMSESAEVKVSREAMAFAMACFWKNGDAYVERATRLTEFLIKVLEEYTTADDLARMDVEAVKATFEELKNAVSRPSPPPAPATGRIP
jgi:hypothetical protein